MTTQKRNDKSTSDSARNSDAFLKQGLNLAVFSWLAFKVDMFGENWQEKALEAGGEKLDNAQSVYRYWVARLPANSHWRLLLIVLPVAGVFTGASAMIGALSVQQHSVVNIWVMLFVFAFAPLLLTLTNVVIRVLLPSATSQLNAYFCGRISQKIAHFPVDRSFTALISAWFALQMQIMALVFLMTAMVTFFAMATFQNYPFGWSSTLIEHNQTMVSILQVVAAPWYWLVQTPSADLIFSTRFESGLPSSASNQADAWWPTLILAMCVYGILPRFMLFLWLRRRLVAQLKTAIDHSFELNRLVNAQSQQASIQPLEIADEVSVDVPVLQASKFDQHTFIAWMSSPKLIKAQFMLGQGRWQDDEHRLQTAELDSSKLIYMVVNEQQTPTLELADCIEILKGRSFTANILVLAQPEQNTPAERGIKSWVYFAQQHGIALAKTEADHEHK